MSESEILAALHAAFVGFVNSALAVWPIFSVLFAASFLDLLSGIFAAVQGHTFDSKFLPAWIDTHSGKIMRVSLIAIAAVTTGGPDTVIGKGLILLGVTEGGLYLAAVVGSIKGNLDDARASIGHFPSFGGTATNLITVGASNDPIDER